MQLVHHHSNLEERWIPGPPVKEKNRQDLKECMHSIEQLAERGECRVRKGAIGTGKGSVLSGSDIEYAQEL